MLVQTVSGGEAPCSAPGPLKIFLTRVSCTATKRLIVASCPGVRGSRNSSCRMIEKSAGFDAIIVVRSSRTSSGLLPSEFASAVLMASS
jgi:hypothetical protein